MPSGTGLRKKLNPALLAGAPYREGELMANRYLVKDAVGVGPLGFVLRTEDRELGIDVSVKLIHPRFAQTGEEREAFLKALEPARRFLHPSLTRLHDVGIDQGWPYFTYTFLDGLPLRRIIDLRLAKGQTFAPDEVEPILGQLMAALEAAHPAGAHGGLKAENILVLPDMLKVTDWGVAAGLPRPPFVQALRQKSAHRHLSPEYLAGLSLQPRADVYSLGVLVGEMLTGLTPEDEIPELRLVNPELPDAMEGFYRRALSERPEARFRSVREMFEAFSGVVEGKPLPAVSSTGATADDGFEVDFVETQTAVVMPEPPAMPPPPAEMAAATELAAAPAEAGPDLLASVAAAQTAPPPAAAPPEPVAAEAPEAPQGEAPVQPSPQPVADAAPGQGAASPETPFWDEANATSSPAATQRPAGETLWSEEEEEAEAEEAPSSASEAQAEPTVLSLAEAPPEVAAALAPAAPSAEEVAPEPEAPSVRPLPALPRIGGPSLAPAPRPSVPAIGLWGPGARRTGAHAAVAVALSESSARVEPLATPPVAHQASADTVAPSLVRPLPPPAPALAPSAVAGHQALSPHKGEHAAWPPPVAEAYLPGDASPPAVRVVATSAHASPPHGEPPAAVTAPARPRPAEAKEGPLTEGPVPTERGHQGGTWSPGAALAEVVSEMRAEDARRLAASESEAAPPASAAPAVTTEHRASRERLALMSASEEPTSPTPAVSGRPRKLPAPPPPAPAKRHLKQLWQKKWLQFAAAGAAAVLLGVLFAVLLHQLH